MSLNDALLSGDVASAKDIVARCTKGAFGKAVTAVFAERLAARAPIARLILACLGTSRGWRESASALAAAVCGECGEGPKIAPIAPIAPAERLDRVCSQRAGGEALLGALLRERRYPEAALVLGRRPPKGAPGPAEDRGRWAQLREFCPDRERFDYVALLERLDAEPAAGAGRCTAALQLAALAALAGAARVDGRAVAGMPDLDERMSYLYLVHRQGAPTGDGAGAAGEPRRGCKAREGRNRAAAREVETRVLQVPQSLELDPATDLLVLKC